MIKMIVKELGNDKKNAVTDILLYSISIATLAISVMLFICAVHIKESTWFQNAQEMQMSEGDLLVSDKAEVLVAVLGVICAVVWLFVICGMFLFVRHSVEKDFHNNSVLEATGYHGGTTRILNILKQGLCITVSVLPAWGIEFLIWKLLQENDVFFAVLEYAKMKREGLIEALLTAYGIALLISCIIVYISQWREGRKTIKVRMQQENR